MATLEDLQKQSAHEGESNDRAMTLVIYFSNLVFSCGKKPD